MFWKRTAAPLAADRQRMIEQDLLARGVRSPQVLAAMSEIPREFFVDAGQAGESYADRALAIDCGQTISQPYMVALMTEALDVRPEHHVLEVGTGSGYQAAVLSRLAHDVVTIERHPLLSEQAAARLAALEVSNVRCLVGDGSLGAVQFAPYDRIIVTAGAIECPPALLAQLAENGLLVAPLGPAEEQVLVRLHKSHGVVHSQALTPCRFVPLIGEQGYAEAAE